MYFDYYNSFFVDGTLKDKKHFDAFKNFCMSHKATVKRMKTKKRRK